MGLGFPLLLLAASVPAATAGFTKGPYLQSPTSDAITICWETDTAEPGTVSWGEEVPGEQTLATDASATHQCVQIEDLEPSTIYAYTVTAGGETSAEATFVTAPHSREPFTFVVVGDTRTGTDDHQAVMDRILEQVGAPDLYVNTGDLVEDGGDAGQWGEFFEIEADLLRYAPLFPVAGNHDDVTNDSYYVQYFDLPDSTSATENYYAFDFGNVHFTVVDTNEDFATGSEQYTWLEADLGAAVADPDIDHLVVSFHHPPYTSGAHGVFDPEEWSEVRDWLVPLFADYGVDVVFSGHDHHYERAWPSLTDGVQYIVTGGGGAPGAPGDYVDGIDSILEYLGMDDSTTVGEYLEENPGIHYVLELLGYATEYEGGWWRAEAEVMKHFIRVDVLGEYMEATVYREDGTEFETWSVGTYDADTVDDDGDGWTEDDGDCDDTDPGVHPGAEDPCNGVDDDCDGRDEGCDTGGEDPADTGAADDEGGSDPEDGEPEGDGAGAEGSTEGGCGCGASPAAALPWALLPLPLLVVRRRDRGGRSRTPQRA